MVLFQELDGGSEPARIYLRDSLYVGSLVKKASDSYKVEHYGIYPCREYDFQRKIFFKKCDDLAYDLRYNAGEYRVIDKNDTVEVGEFAILNSIGLGQLMRFLGYGEELSPKEINQFYRMYLKKGSDHFYYDNAKLFGYQMVYDNKFSDEEREYLSSYFSSLAVDKMQQVLKKGKFRIAENSWSMLNKKYWNLRLLVNEPEKPTKEEVSRFGPIKRKKL